MDFGKDWQLIPSAKSNSTKADRGSRLDNFLARLFHISVKQLLGIRRAGRANLKDPQQRGRKLKETSQQLEQAEEKEAALCLEGLPPPGIVATIPQSFRASPLLQENATIAIVLGRMMFQTLVSSSVHSAYSHRVLQAYLAGAPVGQKHHDHHALQALANAGVALLRADLKSQYALLPEACQHYLLPRCWGAECDSVTLANGSTLMPVFVHFTDSNGRMQCLVIVELSGFYLRHPSMSVAFLAILIQKMPALRLRWHS